MTDTQFIQLQHQIGVTTMYEKFGVYFVGTERFAGYAYGTDAEDAMYDFCRMNGGNPYSYYLEWVGSSY